MKTNLFRQIFFDHLKFQLQEKDNDAHKMFLWLSSGNCGMV